MIESEKKFESRYQSRIYFLIFKNNYNDVLHCQLARKKQFNKRELVDNNIIENLTTLKNVAVLNPIHAAILIIISLILTLIGGYIPAKMASKRNPVESLRTE